VFDEYDAARPDVMFILQRVLEAAGKLTLLDQNRVITPHPYFGCSPRPTPSGWAMHRACITARSPSTTGRWDRWNIVATLNYLPEAEESCDRGRQGTELCQRQRQSNLSSRWWRWQTSPVRG